MKYILETLNNEILLVSLFSCFFAQFLKVFTGKNKIFELKRIATSGGMPSSHSSFVSCMSVMVGLKEGFHSSLFAICFVISLIIMYDASGVRLAVGKQAAILNQILDDIQNRKHIQNEKLKELIGHTPVQVWGGALLGVIIGIIFS